MENNKQYYMETGFSTYIVLLLSIVLAVVNLFDVLDPAVETLELITSTVMLTVFGIFSGLIIFLIVQTKRKIVYIELIEDKIIQHNMFGREIKVSVLGKNDYKKNRRRQLTSIKLYGNEKIPVLVVTDSYSIELTKIREKIERIRDEYKQKMNQI